jgi:F-type H+-transporting ATPase subunit b
VNRLRLLILAAILLGIPLLLASPVFAEEGGGEGGSPLVEVFRWLNFAILAGALGWLLMKKAPAFFSARADRIAAAIEESARVKEQAEQRRRDAEMRLQNLDREIAELRTAAEREAASEAARIQAATQEETARIEKAAEAEVQAAARAARLELKGLAARLALTRAEAVVRAEMTPAGEEGMFQAFVQDLGRSRN